MGETSFCSWAVYGRHFFFQMGRETFFSCIGQYMGSSSSFSWPVYGITFFLQLASIWETVLAVGQYMGEFFVVG